MEDRDDLYLQYRFVDRGGSKVYSIRRRNLSDKDDASPTTWPSIGEVRISPAGGFHMEYWLTDNADPCSSE
jgi:hypothetical protein